MRACAFVTRVKPTQCDATVTDLQHEERVHAPHARRVVEPRADRKVDVAALDLGDARLERAVGGYSWWLRETRS